MILYADCNNGVMNHGDEDLITDVLNGQDFIDALPTLSDTEYIACEEITEEQYEFIKETYGIH